MNAVRAHIMIFISYYSFVFAYICMRRNDLMMASFKIIKISKIFVLPSLYFIIFIIYCIKNYLIYFKKIKRDKLK